MTGLRLLRALGLLSLALFMLAPFSQSILLSFMSTLPREDMPVGTLGLMNYQTLFSDPDLRAALGNSLIVVACNIVICLGVGLPAAYAISRYAFVGGKDAIARHPAGGCAGALPVQYPRDDLDPA